MRFSTAWIAAGLAAAPACARDDLHWVAYPPVGEAGALLIGTDRGQGPELHAIALDGPETPLVLPGPLEAGEPLVIEALVYQRTLSQMSLTAGRIAPAPEGAAHRMLPTPQSVFTYAVPQELGDAAAAWIEAPSASGAIARFRLPATAPACPRFEAELHDVDDPLGGAWAVPLIDGSVLIGMASGRAYRVAPDDRRAVQISVASPLAGIQLASAFAAPDGTLWFGGEQGVLLTGMYQDDVLVLDYLGASPYPGTIRWISGGMTIGGLELFTLTQNGIFARYAQGDAAKWKLLHRFHDDPNDPLADGRGGVAWIAAGDGIAAWPWSSEVHHWRAGSITKESVPTAAGLTAAAWVDQVGALVGTGGGEIMRAVDGRWTKLDFEATGFWIMSIGARPDGFVWGGPWSTAGYYVHGVGKCPLPMIVSHRVAFIARLGSRDIVLLGDDDPTGVTQYAVLHSLDAD